MKRRPAASVFNNNARFNSNTVYCRGIFTSDDDDDDGETLPPNNVNDSVGSTPSQRGVAAIGPGVPLDNTIINAQQRKVFGAGAHPRSAILLH